ncbi:MAG: hypothetical protein QN187_08700 [Armatimonadota bacterium]|nr:hypothetical protein [Armatimonadota bacterium]MDR7520764.1 hypothetical protein [Armatimonadota bacterium]MDR7549239.1 hypothetical protein [Armatimonadota bacterium]
MSSPRAPTDRRPDAPRLPEARRRGRPAEEGTALVLALVVVLVLAVVAGGIAQLVIAEVDMGRLTRDDTEALYLAQAGIEHQIFLLKGDKTLTQGIPYTNYPAGPDQRGWYTTAPPDGNLECLLNCSGNVTARRWRIRAAGQIRRYHPDGTYSVLQTRTLVAEVDITYDGISPLYGTPTRVTVRRWEEALP